MSLKHSCWAFQQPLPNPGQKLVLLILADDCDAAERSGTSVAYVSKMACMPETEVSAALEFLASAGLITKNEDNTFSLLTENFYQPTP